MEVFSVQWLNLSLWLVAACIGLTCAYGVDSNAAKVNGTDGSAAEAVAYDSLVRIGWPLALSWVVFACEKGYGGNSTKYKLTNQLIREVLKNFQ